MVKWLVVIIAFSVLIFSPSVLNFFSADDWFHLKVVQIHTTQEFFNFFSFNSTPQTISFYRPISTHFFFFMFNKLFGLNPTPYYLFSLTGFGFSLYLIYKLAITIFNKEKLALLAVFIYSISVTNFTKLYFLSTFQETSLTVFVLLTVLSYIKNQYFRAVIFFTFALMSKETAVVTPVLLLTLSLTKRQKLKKIIPYLIVSAVYLYLRLLVFKPLEGDSYTWDFSPFKATNTLFWYTIWSFGAPEFLVDYIGSGLRPIQKFFSDFPFWSYAILALMGTAGSAGLYMLGESLKKGLDRKIILSAAWFFISLLPVLFLPQHKFALELTLPTVGFSMGMAFIIAHSKKGLGTFFLISFLILNLSMNYLTYKTHYSVNRAIVTKSIFKYLQNNYPEYPQDSYFEFINDTDNHGVAWGSSKQISHAISRSNMFKVIYNNPDIIVYYEDFLEDDRPNDLNKIPLSTSLFVK